MSWIAKLTGGRDPLRFGLPYGHIAVPGMTIDEAKEAIPSSAGQILDEPIVCVTPDTFAIGLR